MSEIVTKVESLVSKRGNKFYAYVIFFIFFLFWIIFFLNLLFHFVVGYCPCTQCQWKALILLSRFIITLRHRCHAPMDSGFLETIRQWMIVWWGLWSQSLILDLRKQWYTRSLRLYSRLCRHFQLILNIYKVTR